MFLAENKYQKKEKVSSPRKHIILRNLRWSPHAKNKKSSSGRKLGFFADFPQIFVDFRSRPLFEQQKCGRMVSELKRNIASYSSESFQTSSKYQVRKF